MTSVIVSPQQVQKLLTKLPSGAKVELSKTPDGAILMTTTEPQKTKEQIIKEKYPHLAGQNITLSDAAEKYGLPRSTVKSWVYQSKYLAPIDPDAYPMFVNEAEIAYLVDIYNGRKRTNSKAPLVDDNGLPYKLKRPRLAQYRKNKKTTP